ncbi:MAG: MFS transporter [Ilumatobacteraceae bacterium]
MISNLGDGVGQIAYPWLASAVTRNPLLIALVAVAQRLPWLLFSLPAGVITDRNDRRALMSRMNAIRAVLTVGVAVLVLIRSSDLPGPDEIATAVVSNDALLYLAILLATLLLGTCEVLYDNSSQTFLPAIVAPADLERANGRMWSAEMVANSFAGPPLGALLLAAGFALPFFLDAGSFAASAALIVSMRGVPRRQRPLGDTPPSFRAELKEGLGWLWAHELLRPLAITLGLLNAIGMMTTANLVLFAQESLHTSATEFALLGTGAAIGGVLGGWIASPVAKKLGPGPSLWLVLVGGGVFTALIGFAQNWYPVWLLTLLYICLGVIWNVITVSLRQRIIPDRLLGRVNSVYRFFAWGMMPLGSLLGGALVVAVDKFAPRDLALRVPWFVAGAPTWCCSHSRRPS